MKNLCPDYLKELVNIYTPGRILRSSEAVLLEKTVCRRNFSSRSFENSAPTLWNTLKADTRSATTHEDFKKRLKTELFMRSYTNL